MIGVAILAALAAGLTPDDPGLLRVAPHPLVFVVAIVAARHGPAGGAASGLLAAALHLAAQVHAARGASAGAGASLIDLAGRADAVAPLALLVLGLGLGELRRRQAAAEGASRRARQDVIAERDALRTRLALSEATRQELERRAVEPTATLAAVHEGTERLDALDAAEVPAAIVDLVARHLLASSAALYLVEEGKLRRRAFRGGDPEPPETRPLDDGLVGAALREKRTLSARDPAARPAAASGRARGVETLLAAPLLAEDGTPLGAIAVDALPLVSLTSSAERILAMLAAHASRAVARTAGRPRAGDSRIYDETVGALRYAHLVERLADEFERSRRYKTPFSLLLLEIEEFDAVPPAGRAPLRTALAQALRNVVRKVDHVFIYRDDRSFAVTLPHTPEPGAALVLERVREEVDRYGLAPYREPGRLEFQLGFATRKDEMRSPADLAKAAEDACAAPIRPGEGEEGAEPPPDEEGTERIPALTPEAIEAARAEAAASRAAGEAPAEAPAAAEAPSPDAATPPPETPPSPAPETPPAPPAPEATTPSPEAAPTPPDGTRPAAAPAPEAPPPEALPPAAVPAESLAASTPPPGSSSGERGGATRRSKRAPKAGGKPAKGGGAKEREGEP